MTNTEKSNPGEYRLEWKGLQYFLGIMLVQLLLVLLGYYAFFIRTPNFLAKYGLWLFYLIFTISSIATALWIFFAYKTRINCMTGMMIGMTFGMQSGMMIGVIFGATNGFFVGCLIGIATSVTIGILTGKCCGIMGIMEGMMAGLMAGTMGPMIAIMMLNDHLILFMPIFMIVNLMIIAGLCIMLHQELGKKEGCIVNELDFLTLASVCVIALFIFSLIMLFAYKSAVTVL